MAQLLSPFLPLRNGGATPSPPPYHPGAPRSHALWSFRAASVGTNRAFALPIHTYSQGNAVNILGQALEREYKSEEHYDNYTNPEIFDNWLEGHVHASNLASCTLDQLPEWAKSEFTTVSITLGLVPPALLALGPDTTGMALLSIRRPLLASLLAFGSPALRTGSDPVEFLKLTPKVRFDTTYLAVGPGNQNWRLWTCVVVFSVVEYAIAGAAVFNVAYQVWFLTYQAVCWAAIQLFQTTFLPETAEPLLWVLFGVPMKLMCDYAILWRIKKADGKSSLSGATRPTAIQKSISWIISAVASELTPCMYSEPLYFHAVEEGPAWLFFTQFVNLASLAHVLMGGIILSTIFFVLFRKAVVTVALFLAAAVACKFVLSFELHWMRLNASEAQGEVAYQTVLGKNI
ncbi:hypothetical protein F5B18DRAFT_573232 [Nemania serpens]|nr:hypothetical protein F5B18DRAFT_573232 [Nemania serpens]